MLARSRFLLSAAAVAVTVAVTTGACRPGGGGAAAPPPAVQPFEPSPTDDPAARRGILRRAGVEIVDAAGAPVRLRGIGFGNQVWSNRALPVQHHGEVDFQRVRAMGMNSIRFYLYAGTLEDAARPGVYKEAGWQWLDRNVAWARRHGVYLVLNVHVPPGGFQSMGEGRSLWEAPANQDRLVALWRAIAARYAREPMIAGYDLLNEPGVTRAKAQWQTLAARIVKAIREVDGQHLVIVERVNSIAKQWNNDADMNFFAVDDPQVVYTFHFYDPFDYTHQLAPWAKLGEGGRYPDASKLAHSPDTKWLNIATFASPRLPAGTSDWTRSDGPRLSAADPRVAIGRVSLVGRGVGAGRAFFDDLVIQEHGADGEPVREVARLDLRALGGWFFWTSNKSGRAGTSPDGHDGPGALTITGTTDDANLGGWQHDFAPTPGHAYSVSGWMKGQDLPANAVVQIRLDFLGSDTPTSGRDKAFLARQLDRYVAWGRAHGAPVYLGEWGLHRPCFEDGRGGLTWVEDMLDLIAERGLHWSYHAYHEDAFGLYYGSGAVDPTRANAGLIELFTRKLAPAAAPAAAAPATQ